MSDHNDIYRHLIGYIQLKKLGKEEECKWIVDYYNKHDDKVFDTSAL